MAKDFIAQLLEAINEEMGDGGWYDLGERGQVHYVLEKAQNRLHELLEEKTSNGKSPFSPHDGT